MIRIKMIVAGSDKLYRSSLCDYFMEKAPQLERRESRFNMKGKQGGRQ